MSYSLSDSSVDEHELPRKKHRQTLLKPPITIPETQSAEKPQCLHLSQQHSASESTDGNRSGRLRCSYSSHIEYLSANDPEESISDNDNTTQHDDSCIVGHNSETSTTSNSVTIMNAQLQKYPSTHPPQSGLGVKDALVVPTKRISSSGQRTSFLRVLSQSRVYESG